MQSQANESANPMEIDVNESGEEPALQNDENLSEPHLLDHRDRPNYMESDFTTEVVLEDSIIAPS